MMFWLSGIQNATYMFYIQCLCDISKFNVEPVSISWTGLLIWIRINFMQTKRMLIWGALFVLKSRTHSHRALPCLGDSDLQVSWCCFSCWQAGHLKILGNLFFFTVFFSPFRQIPQITPHSLTATFFAFCDCQAGLPTAWSQFLAASWANFSHLHGAESFLRS